MKWTDDTKLPKAFKAKWVKALRSGKFKQASHTLLEIKRRPTTGEPVQRSYCCLGVAAAISGYTDEKLSPCSMLNSNKDWRKVPIQLREKKCGDNDLTEFLSARNDEGWSFKKIATWIDKNL